MSGTETLFAPEGASAALAKAVAETRFDDLPAEVISRAEEAFADWVGCALGGYGARPALVLERFAETMGPAGGTSQIIGSGKFTSPYFAALVNGAASHIVEQDDVHNVAMFHPGTVVFPAVFAAAQQASASGEQFLVASVMGYEVAIRTGIFLGPAHYEVFHTTGTAGMVGAAAGVARVLGLSARETLHALGTAGTQAAALWEFLRDGADSKILHSGKAAANGVLSAYLARDGFTGASQILEGKQGLAAGLSRGPVKSEALTEGLGERWKILECTYKPYACCRHTHPSADALRAVMREHMLTPDDIEHVTAHVHRGAVDVLGQVVEPATVYQSKFSLGFVLALVAYRDRAGVSDFNEASLHDPQLRAFARRVEMVLDPTIPRDASRRPGRVVVTIRDGTQYEVRIAEAKGDPGNSMSRFELEEKVQSLAEYSGRLQPDDVRRLLDAIWGMRSEANLDRFTLPVAKEI